MSATRARRVHAALEAAELPLAVWRAAWGNNKHAVAALLCAAAVLWSGVSCWLWRSGAKRLSSEASAVADTMAIAHCVWRAAASSPSFTRAPLLDMTWLAVVVAEADYTEALVRIQQVLILLGFVVSCAPSRGAGAAVCCWPLTAVLASLSVFRKRCRTDRAAWNEALDSLVLRLWKFWVLIMVACERDDTYAGVAGSWAAAFSADVYCSATMVAPLVVLFV